MYGWPSQEGVIVIELHPGVVNAYSDASSLVSRLAIDIQGEAIAKQLPFQLTDEL